MSADFDDEEVGIVGAVRRSPRNQALPANPASNEQAEGPA
jgi:hypothetical protein